MKNRLLIGLSLLAVPIVLVLVLILGLLIFIDPNDYKEEISARVYDVSGYQLQLQGNLSWSFYPQVGVKTEQVSLSLGPSWPHLASVGEFGLGVQLMPLLQKKIEVDSLLLSDLDVRLAVDEQGRANWSAAGSGPKPSQDQPQPEPHPETEQQPVELPELSIASVKIQNAQLSYVDAVTGAEQRVHIDSLTMSDVALDKPVELQVQIQWQDASGLQAELSVDSELVLKSDFSNRDATLL